MSIKFKVILPVIGFSIASCLAIIFTAMIIFTGFVNSSAQHDLDISSGVLQMQLETKKADTKIAAKYLANNNEFIAAISDSDVDEQSAIIAAALADTGMSFVTLTDETGTVILRSHEPAKKGDNIAKRQSIQEAMGGSIATYVETGSEIPLSVRSSAPVYDAKGKLIAVVMIGYRLDTDEFVDEMKSTTGSEVTVFLGDTRLSTTVMDAGGKRAVGTKAAENVSAAVLGGKEYSGEAEVVGRNAMVNYVPIYTYNNEIVGMLFAGVYTDGIEKQINSFILISALIALAIIVLATVISIVISNRIVVPIRSLVGAADKLASGATDVDVEVRTKDETRSLAESFRRMIEGTRAQAEIIKSIAEGDLSVEISRRSEMDEVGNALESMLNLNNQVFSEIIFAANQVSDGARQIAGGAHSLAQGSTEQTAAVDGLLNSISTIAEMARDNSKLATEAAALGASIKGSAVAGSEQMQKMIAAVNDINESSIVIGKVIKTIDDIAFQTNILALNAAVEAARAGQHGKGFAVVAEEVRTLAAKSATAANDTSTLISDSMIKAAEGAKIAAETAESLNKIVMGINNTSKLFDDILNSSNEQSGAIEGVRVRISEVADVVQQNSAMAEESSAASAEMENSSTQMQRLVSQFKLKDQAPRSLAEKNFKY